MFSYIPPTFDLWEASESGNSFVDCQRWLYDIQGRVDLPVESVTLGYRSRTLAVLVGTAIGSKYDEDSDLKSWATRILIQGTESSSGPSEAALSPTQMHQTVQQITVDKSLWTQWPLMLNSHASSGYIASWGAGWAFYSRQGPVCFAVAGLQPLPSPVSLRQVTSSDDYGLDLSRSWTLNELNANHLVYAPPGAGLR